MTNHDRWLSAAPTENDVWFRAVSTDKVTDAGIPERPCSGTFEMTRSEILKESWDAEIGRHSPRLLCTALMDHANESAARLWQRLSNPISSTSKQMKLQISQRRRCNSQKKKNCDGDTICGSCSSEHNFKRTTRVVCKSMTIIYEVSIAQKIELRLFSLLLVGKWALWVRTWFLFPALCQRSEQQSTTF